MAGGATDALSGAGEAAGGLGGANPIGLVTGGLSAAGDFANGDYVKGGLGAVSTIAPLFGPIGMGIGLAASLGSKIYDMFSNDGDKMATMAQSQKGLENIQSFSNQKKDENARQLEQQGNAIQQQLAQNTGMQDLFGAYQAGKPSYEDFINNSELNFDYVMMAYPTNDGMAKKVYDMIKNKNDQLPIIYIGPFNAEYTKDDFVDTVSVLNNESIDKINESFNYWTAHPFLKDSTIKLVI